MRRTSLLLAAALVFVAARADAVTLRDIIELSKAGLSDQVLLTLIEVDHSMFSIDASALKQLKEAGVSEEVIIAMIRSGRTPAAPEAAPAPQPEPPSPAADPQVIVIDHHDSAPAPAPVYVPVAVPVAVPIFVPNARPFIDTVNTTIRTTDGGEFRARVPVPQNCVKAEPVYWGFGGKLRPDAWQPNPTIVCR
jgi:hypothetical protein